MTAHHRFLLELHLGQIDALRAAVQKLEQQADEVLRPFREAAERLTTIPGVVRPSRGCSSPRSAWT